MIDLGTLAGLLKHDPQLAAYCQACDRRVEFDLARLRACLVVGNHRAESERREVATHPPTSR